jgi:hypothetical protein
MLSSNCVTPEAQRSALRRDFGNISTAIGLVPLYEEVISQFEKHNYCKGKQ